MWKSCPQRQPRPPRRRRRREVGLGAQRPVDALEARRVQPQRVVPRQKRREGAVYKKRLMRRMRRRLWATPQA